MWPYATPWAAPNLSNTGMRNDTVPRLVDVVSENSSLTSLSIAHPPGRSLCRSAVARSGLAVGCLTDTLSP